LWILNTSFGFFIQLLCLLFYCSIVVCVSVVFYIAFLTVCAALWRNKECYVIWATRKFLKVRFFVFFLQLKQGLVSSLLVKY